MSPLVLILLVILVIFVLGGAPLWPHGGFGYGWGASGLGTVLLVILVILLLSGRI